MTHSGGEDPICNDLGFSSQRQRQNDKQGAKKLQLSSSSVLDKNVYLALLLIFTSPWRIWNKNMFLCYENSKHIHSTLMSIQIKALYECQYVHIHEIKEQNFNILQLRKSWFWPRLAKQ